MNIRGYREESRISLTDGESTLAFIIVTNSSTWKLIARYAAPDAPEKESDFWSFTALSRAKIVRDEKIKEAEEMGWTTQK